jgi:hypothetical protein
VKWDGENLALKHDNNSLTKIRKNDLKARMTARIETRSGSRTKIDEVHAAALGCVTCLGAASSKRNKLEFKAAYEIAAHSYAETDRWSRVSHNMNTSYEIEFKR